MQKETEYKIDNQDYFGVRLDKMLAKELPEISRSKIQTAIKSQDILVNNKKAVPKQKLQPNDLIRVIIKDEVVVKYEAQKLDLNIIFEDDDIMIINKQVGLVVHPGAGNYDKTLLNGLLYHNPKLELVPRAGIVHRLDKNTSGLLVVAKTVEAQFDLVKQLQERSVKRQYLALVNGEFSGGGTIRTNIGRCHSNRIKMAVVSPNSGKEAITHYQVEKRFKGVTLLKCQLETGRTHQIRVHLSHINHAIIGDTLYNGRARIPKGINQITRDIILSFDRQALHAKTIAFIHPKTKKTVRFDSELSDDFSSLIEKLEV